MKYLKKNKSLKDISFSEKGHWLEHNLPYPSTPNRKPQVKLVRVVNPARLISRERSKKKESRAQIGVLHTRLVKLSVCLEAEEAHPS